MADSRKKSKKNEKPDSVSPPSSETKATKLKAGKSAGWNELKSKTVEDAPVEEKNPAGKKKSAEEKKETPAMGKKEALARGKTEEPAPTYEVTSPPPSFDRPQGHPLRTLLVLIILTGSVGGGAYLSWPRWSPYVAPYFPMLEYKPANDIDLAKLSIRIEALETNTKSLSTAQKTIAEMETERARLQDGVKVLLGRLNQMEKAVDNVKQMIAATGVGKDNEEARRSFERISKRLSQLEKSDGTVETLVQRVKQMESGKRSGGNKNADEAIKRAQEASQRLSDVVHNIESRLNKFETSRAEQTELKNEAPASAIILAISQLRKTVLSGQPYVMDLEALRAVSGENQGMKAALLVLNTSAASGVLSVSELRNRFSRAAGAIVRASGALEGGGWFGQAVNRIRSFISVRRIDGKSEDASVDTIVLGVEESLKAGNLAGAVGAIKGLVDVSVPAAKIAAPWLSLAKARLSAERSLASLHVYAVTLVAATKE